jgi:hypothetical protein
LRPAGIFSLYSKAEAKGWKDQNQNPVVFAFGNPTLAQNARVGHPRGGQSAELHVSERGDARLQLRHAEPADAGWRGEKFELSVELRVYVGHGGKSLDRGGVERPHCELWLRFAVQVDLGSGDERSQQLQWHHELHVRRRGKPWWKGVFRACGRPTGSSAIYGSGCCIGTSWWRSAAG